MNNKIVKFGTKEDRLVDKMEYMLEHEDEVDWVELMDEMYGFSTDTQYQDIVDALPEIDEAEKVLKDTAEERKKLLKKVEERSKQIGPRIIKEPETMEEAVNMSDEDFYELLKQDEMRRKAKSRR
ncbi:MAG: hypothetical protein IJI65_01960 [Lachnospiraceae bacterium]|nr:hypothetical protein [Lachnospiraceae bacterium]